jgi:THO complex subunit 4
LPLRKHQRQQLLRDSQTACRTYQCSSVGIETFADNPLRQPKNAAKDKARTQDKPKTNNAATTNGTSKSKNTRNKKPARTGRSKKKTAEELDAEMVDYFGAGGEGGAPNGTTQQAAAAGGDAMVDEVL